GQRSSTRPRRATFPCGADTWRTPAAPRPQGGTGGSARTSVSLGSGRSCDGGSAGRSVPEAGGLVSSTRHALVEKTPAGTSGHAGDVVASDDAAARGEAAARGDTVAGRERRGRVSARDRAGVGVGPGRTPDAGSPAGGRGAGAGRSPIDGRGTGGRTPRVGRSASPHVTVGGGGRRRLLAVGIALAAAYPPAACPRRREPHPPP